MSKPEHLLDVSALVALADPRHVHHRTVMDWFNTPALRWGLCAFSQAGFLRVTANPRVGAHSMNDAIQVLAGFTAHRGYRYWPITADWAELVAPFQERVWGHQQVTDAWLLGLTLKQNGVLVTLDKAFNYLAGAEYRKNVLVLE